jgi:hypothetical protein
VPQRYDRTHDVGVHQQSGFKASVAKIAGRVVSTRVLKQLQQEDSSAARMCVYDGFHGWRQHREDCSTAIADRMYNSGWRRQREPFLLNWPLVKCKCASSPEI